MKKVLIIVTFILNLTDCFSQVVLIDPGHGGEDCGAKSYLKQKSKVCEKDIALELSLLIKEELGRKYKVYLTRSIDRELSLEERAELADKIKADIFISVHANASHQKSPNGFETYYLDNHKNKAVQKVEAIENRNAKGQELIVNEILADLVIKKTAPQSRKLGMLIHQNISRKMKKKFSKTRDRGAKPALFYVLALSKRPSVLLEAGFMSNKNDRDKLMSKRYQRTYAKGVANGIKEYLKKFFTNEPPLF